LGHEAQDQYAEAEALYGCALWINEKALGPDHPHVEADLNNLAGPYSAQGKYAEAESILNGALLLLFDNLLGYLCRCGRIGDDKEEKGGYQHQATASYQVAPQPHKPFHALIPPFLYRYGFAARRME
jgi:hypothetical protein